MSERTKQIKNMLKHSTTMPMGAGGNQTGVWMMGSAAHNHSHHHHHEHAADGSCCGHDHSHDHHHDDEEDTTNPSGGCC